MSAQPLAFVRLVPCTLGGWSLSWQAEGRILFYPFPEVFLRKRSQISVLFFDSIEQLASEIPRLVFFNIDLKHFPIQNYLKQGDALSPLLFSFAFEYTIRRV
jgi:hypothetical protein